MPVCVQPTVNDWMECGVHCAVGLFRDQLEIDHLVEE